LCEHFFTDFATEFHEQETEKGKEELLSFIFEIVEKTPKEDLLRPEVEQLLRDFMLNKYFSQKKERRPIVLKMMQMIRDRTGRFIELDQGLEYIKGKCFRSK
jgi:hypothetical protein